MSKEQKHEIDRIAEELGLYYRPYPPGLYSGVQDDCMVIEGDRDTLLKKIQSIVLPDLEERLEKSWFEGADSMLKVCEEHYEIKQGKRQNMMRDLADYKASRSSNVKS